MEDLQVCPFCLHTRFMAQFFERNIVAFRPWWILVPRSILTQLFDTFPLFSVYALANLSSMALVSGLLDIFANNIQASRVS